MKFEKVITVHLGNEELLKIGVSECDSFIECDKRLFVELEVLGLKSKVVKQY